MLVLTVKEGKPVYIGEGAERVEVQVVDIQGGRVRLGFVARRDVLVARGDLKPEALERMRQDATAARSA